MISASDARSVAGADISTLLDRISSQVISHSICKIYECDIPLDSDALKNPALRTVVFEQLHKLGYKVSMAKEMKPSKFTISWRP